MSPCFNQGSSKSGLLQNNPAILIANDNHYQYHLLNYFHFLFSLCLNPLKSPAKEIWFWLQKVCAFT